MNPAIFNLTGWWRGSYSGTPWTSIASAGSSSGQTLSTGVVPSVGSAQNGFTPSDYDGATTWLDSALPLSSYFSAAAGTLIMLVKPTATATNNANSYDNPGLARSGAASYLVAGWSASGFVAQINDGAAQQITPISASAASYHKFVMKWSGSTLRARVDSGAWQSIACGNLADLTFTFQVGQSANAWFYQGSIMEVITSAITLSDANCDDIGLYMQERYALSLGFLPRISVYVPDFIDRRRLTTHPSLMQATASVITATLSTTPTARRAVHPDVFDRHSHHRMMHASRAPHAVSTAALPRAAGASSALRAQPGEYPDFILRPSLRAEQQLAAAWPPIQFTAGALTPIGLTEFPDTVTRPSLRAEQQQAVSDLGPTPLGFTVSQLAIPEYPDSVTRPFLRAESQLASPTPSPVPERTSVLASTEYPDVLYRPWFAVSLQQATTTLSPVPLGSTVGQLASSAFPDIVPRAWLATARQPATVIAPQQPAVATTPVGLVSFPDAVVRPAMRPDAQQAAVWPAFQFSTATTPVGMTTYPDQPCRVPGACIVGTPRQHMSTPAGVPLGSTVGQLATAEYPDLLTRPALHVSQQLATTELPAFPLSLAITPYALTWYPDAVVRPTFRAELQLATTNETPSPLGSTVGQFASAAFPASVFRPSLLTADQQAVGALYPTPLVVAFTPIALTSYPDAVARASMLVAAQLAWVSSARPERTASIVATSYPDRFPTAVLPVSSVQAFALPPQPERTAPLADVEYPDRVVRPVLATAFQQHVAHGLRPEQTAALDWQAFFPERLMRPAMRADQQLATVIAPRQLSAAIAAAFFPEAVRRAFFPVTQQRAWFYGTFLTPAALLKLPSCSTGVLALATTCFGILADATISAANLAIATSSFGAISDTTTTEGAIALATSDRGTLEGCND